jgi:homoserine kinase
VQVAGILTGNVELLGRALGEETVIEAARGPLIPGFAQVKQAAMDAGAHGCTISGAGPTVVAVVGSDTAAGQHVGEAMSKAFADSGGLETNSVQVVLLDREGARRTDVPEGL